MRCLATPGLDQSTNKRRYIRSIYSRHFWNFNWGMTRCYSCNGIITRTDSECFTCGEPVPGAKRFRRQPKQTFEAKPAEPAKSAKAATSAATGSDLVFISLLVSSLALMAVCFVTHLQVPISVSAGLSGVLFTAKIVTDLRAKRIQLQ